MLHSRIKYIDLVDSTYYPNISKSNTYNFQDGCFVKILKNLLPFRLLINKSAGHDFPSKHINVLKRQEQKVMHIIYFCPLLWEAKQGS